MMGFNKFLLILLFLFGFSSAVQSQFSNDKAFKELILSDPSIIKDLQENNENQNINEDLISQNQDIANTSNITKKNVDKAQKPRIDLNAFQNNNIKNADSALKRYFNNLTGEMLDVYGSSEFSQVQDNNLLFFNNVGKDYQLAPGDVIQVIITGLSASNETYQIENDGTITLENTYPINVNGLNIGQVSNLILDKILLDDASANVFVRLNT